MPLIRSETPPHMSAVTTTGLTSLPRESIDGTATRHLSVIANTVFLAHIPFALIEGAITAFMVAYMKRAAPDLLMGVER